jgi:hypothetical protein
VVVSVGYEHGSLPELVARADADAGGVAAPRLAVPGVHPGALLLDRGDATGPGLDLLVPDTGGTGVFSLHSGGTAVTGAKASSALLAVLSAARRAYG